MPAKVTLENAYVQLDSLAVQHLDALCEIGLDEDLWRWTPYPVTTRKQMQAYIEQALLEQRQEKSLPFIIVSLADGCISGCTRFGNIDLANKRVEIGWTWIGKPWQRTAVNTATKLLMLTHAFDTLGCNRVELKTDALNERSRKAILRLGANEEGTLRKHMLTASGRIRNTVYFSIVDDEWPAVKKTLENKLQEYEPA
jgi:RimJ/RimL family protein N-acetyltransferase